MCDEPWSKQPHASLGQDKTASPRHLQLPGCQATSHLQCFRMCYTLCPEGSVLHASFVVSLSPLHPIPTSGPSSYTPSSRKSSLTLWSRSSALLLYSKSPSHLLLRWSPYLTLAVSLFNSRKIRPVSGSQLQLQSPARALNSRHQKMFPG